MVSTEVKALLACLIACCAWGWLKLHQGEVHQEVVRETRWVEYGPWLTAKVEETGQWTLWRRSYMVLTEEQLNAQIEPP